MRNKNTLSEREALILGALLHDVGKFIQRAQDKPATQDHSHWGEEWFENNLAEKLTAVFSKKEIQTIRSAIGNHHEYEEYISLSDAISAGMDRIKLEDEEEGDPFTDRLISVFSRISVSSERKKDMYHKLASLGEDYLEDIFPIDDKKCSSKEYARLLTAFDQEIKLLNFDNLSHRQVIDALYFLLWKYTWSIPSAVYKDEPDVSLFDHLKSTAAIACCLYDYHRENTIESPTIGSPAFCLIGGDISGIQGYIFNLPTQQGKIAKRLRARSLFVQLFSEIAAHKILHSFNLPLCNLIVSAGGNFYVPVPNLKETNRKIMELQREFDEWTLNELNAELSVTLAGIKLSGRDFGDFSKTFERLKTNLNHRKYQSHRLILASGDEWLPGQFLRPEVIGGEEKVCQGCRRYPQKEIEYNEDHLCERCLNDTKIGQLLPKKKYLAFFNSDQQEFKILNYSFDLWDEEDLKNHLTKKPYLVMVLNTPDIRFPVMGFKYLMTHIPTKKDIAQASTEVENQPVSFDDIVNTSQGDRLLGYIKGDVDGLGDILRNGFGSAKLKDKHKRRGVKPSISRFTTFSRMLETFFSGYLQIKLKKDFETMYTVFSGGDDFFVIGPWNKAIEFVQELRKQFSRFCATNSDLTFSAGIILSKPYEPVSFCAKSVEERLKDSKRQEGKDAITIFNQTVGWDTLDKILIESNKVIEWLGRKPPLISRSFAHNLREYGEMSQQYEKTRNVEYLKFVPLLAYDISRNLTFERQREAFEWATELIPSKTNPHGGDNLPYLRIIMEYVLTYTRG